MNSLINEVTLTGVINGYSELVGSIQSAHFLYGIINPSPQITGQISGGRVGNLTGTLQSNETISGTITFAGVEEPYQGSYEITPKTHSQTLPTENKIMKENVFILEIPYYETSNLSGKTVYIGGE